MKSKLNSKQSFGSIKSKVTPGNPMDTPSRKGTPITTGDIPRIAALFFGGEELAVIASEYDVEMFRLTNIITGNNFSDEWSSAVVDLIVDGVDCSRSITESAYKRQSPKLQAEVVLKIRSMHMEGESMETIHKATCVRTPVIKGVISGRNYGGAEYIPNGWENRNE